MARAYPTRRALLHMDLPRRLAELEPQLVHEAEYLHARIVSERADSDG